MALLDWLRPPRHLLLLFVGIIAGLAAAFGWLGWRLLEQDRALERQRTQDRVESVADSAIAALARELSDEERSLRDLVERGDADLAQSAADHARALGAECALVVFDGPVVSAFPPSRLAYQPGPAAPDDAAAEAFVKGEAQEFQQDNPEGAIATYTRLSRSSDEAVRIGARVRLARTYWRSGRPADAAAIYQDLAGYATRRLEDGRSRGAPRVFGRPVDLVARHAECTIDQELGRKAALRECAASLYGDLIGGRWLLEAPVRAYHLKAAEGWLGADDALVARLRAQNAVALSIAAVVDALFEQWAHGGRREKPPLVARVRVDSQPWIALMHAGTERTVALVAGPRTVADRWLGRVRQAIRPTSTVIGLSDDGTWIVPLPGHLGTPVVRVAASTGLPWTVHAAAAPGKDRRSPAPRRLLLAGFALVATVLVVGAVFIGRTLTHDLEVARMQKDFVAAVSHEFRTPLASLCQIGELLADDRVPDEGLRRRYYAAIQHESERLRRLIEALLDFARMEAGRCEYRFEPIAAASFVRGIGHDFSRETADGRARVEIDVPDTLPAVRADVEALGRAIWNLLDNAVKYSPPGAPVTLTARQEHDVVAIRVRDEGPGIPWDEQGRIFEKFARGASAVASGARGTGLGLAMVQHIVAGHGGRITLDSEPGCGSTFTIALPLLP